MTTTPAAGARDIAIEAAAHAMRNATDRAAVGMSMRGRRDLAALAYDAIRGTIAAKLDEHRDRAEAANNLLANAEHHLTAAREELAKTRAELAGRVAWLYRNSTRMTQMRYDAATAAGYDFTQYAAQMDQPVDRDALIAYLREEITLAEQEIAAIEANPATTAEPADEPKATCGCGRPTTNGVCTFHGRALIDATPAQVRP